MLREDGRVHDLCWVAYGSWNGYIHKLIMGNPLELKGNPSEATTEGDIAVPDSYAAILTFAQLAFQVFGVAGPIPGYSFGFNKRSLKQVWPRLDCPIAWPLFPPIQDSNLRDLAELVPFSRK
jgi:hypothetical protein